MASGVSPTPSAGQTKPKQMATVSRKKHLSPELQCIIRVLDESVRKIDVLSVLPCELVHPELVSQELGNTVVESLREHLQLSEKYHSLQEQGKDMQTEESITEAVQNSLRNFLRHVGPYKLAEPMMGVLKCAGPIVEEDQKAVRELGMGLQELRAMLKERLMTTPQEEQEHRRYCEEVRKRQEHNLAILYSLEQKMREETTYRDKMMGKKDAELQNLKDSLHQVKKMREEFVLQVQKMAEQQHQSDQKNSEMKCLCLQEEANQLRAQLDQLTMQNREKEMTLSKKNNKLETELENWIKKYDVEMDEKQTKLEHLMQAFQVEQAELHELQEHYAIVELEYSQIMEERRKENERREEQERERQTKTRAAVIIQALWRGWRVRNAMKSKKKGKKGGKETKNKKGK